MPETETGHYSENDIAVVGMALRVPGARTPREFWSNLRRGVCSITQFRDEDLLAAGVPARHLKDPQYIKVGGVLDDLALFDADFFGLSPKEGAIMDPQHRHFLECSWEALEDAGYYPERFDGSIGVFAGCGMGSYFMFNVLSNADLVKSVGLFLLRHTGNDKDFLATRCSYALNLTGPSLSIQTACSTSLVAIHSACQNLLNFECDMALAGGVTIEIPHRQGYWYKEGEILAPDGVCRPYDHQAKGTLFGSGAGVVVLRRLSEAMEDGDRIHGIIKGSAVNNDGASKAGYLAPSVEGQAAAAAEAIAVAKVPAETIGFMEGHGTGTPVGDPIEIAALTKAFRQSTDKKNFCTLGSVKANIGHLDTAAGIAGFIKTVMALSHGEIPPNPHFKAPNPNIDFESSPFRIQSELKPWPKGAHPRRAAVNSLGVGGTNAHVILEQAPRVTRSSSRGQGPYLFILSAKSKYALNSYSAKLANHLEMNPDLHPEDVTHTLFHRRKTFSNRGVFAAQTLSEARSLLEERDPRHFFTHNSPDRDLPLYFMFPGGGVQYPGMGLGLYRKEPVFRQYVDDGLTMMANQQGLNLRPYLEMEGSPDELALDLERPALQLPLLFIVQYALAQLCLSRGLQPQGLLGHSMGENTAACLAGVFSYADALGLVALRGRLFESLPPGGMIGVPMDREALLAILPNDLDLATANGPGLCVVSGPVEPLQRFSEYLQHEGLEPRKIRISVAAHSRMLDPILDQFRIYLNNIKMQQPVLPFVSNLTGTWITGQQATDPNYWCDHLRHVVLFQACAETLLSDQPGIMAEMGPGNTLCSLMKLQSAVHPANPIAMMRRADEEGDDETALLTAMGRIWASGGTVPQASLNLGSGNAVSLPTYAFRHKHYWIEPAIQPRQAAGANDSLRKLTNRDHWCSYPNWQPDPGQPGSPREALNWLVFLDDAGLGKKMKAYLEEEGHHVIVVREADAYQQLSSREYALSPEQGQAGYLSLVRELVSAGRAPHRILHMWMVTDKEHYRPGSSFFHRNQERGFYSLFFLAKALGEENVVSSCHILAFANGMVKVAQEALPYPEKATMLGPCRVIPREFPNLTVNAVDLVLPPTKARWLGGEKLPADALATLFEQVKSECLLEPDNRVVAYRKGNRLVQTFQRKKTPIKGPIPAILRQEGCYLITGGLGGLGLVFAEFLAREYKARLVLVSRKPIPPREQWDRETENGRTHSEPIAKIRQFESLGAQVMVGNADVTDVEAMGRVVDAAKAQFGQINGIFHMAGILRDELIQLKTQFEIEEVFSPKVQGTLVLERLFQDEHLDFTALFSSASTAVAPPGQVDYVAANEFLNAIAQSRDGLGGKKVIAVNWGPWNEVGMTAALVNQHHPVAAHGESGSPTQHPFFETRMTDPHAHTSLLAQWSPRTHWLLDEHRTAEGHALIPGTGYIEMARAALREQGETRAFEIANLFFLMPAFVGDRDDLDIRVQLAPIQEGYRFKVQSHVIPQYGPSGWLTHAQADLIPCGPSGISELPLENLRQRCQERAVHEEQGIRINQESHLQLGPRWRCLKRIAFGNQEGIAEIELPRAFHDDLISCGIHPAMLDMATGFPLELVDGYRESRQLWVPVSYKSIRMHNDFPARVFCWVKVKTVSEKGEPLAVFDMVIADTKGRILLEIEEFVIKQIIGGKAFRPSSSPTPDEVDRHDTAQGRELSPAEAALKQNLEQGILPEEGTVLLRDLLSQNPGPVVYLSSLGLQEQFDQVTQLTATRETSQNKFERPDLDSEYEAPSDDIEKALVGFWEELLGVDSIGIDDSFFDLGGHSLIAVRLFAKIKKVFHVEYPISVLFEAPTIRRCAALLRQGSQDEKEAETTPKSKKRHTHLVAMHAGKPGNKTPFFLVAGMFGNVLNLRHLAHLIGADRPFYGLQARGLYGDERPHDDFVEMAADYLSEVRKVQPRGPYLLAGFSGGGITAYEMAQQLLAQGEQTALLVMLDTPLPRRPGLSFRDKLGIHGQRLREDGLGYVTEWAGNRMRWELKRWHDKFFRDGEADLQRSDFHSQAIEAAFREALLKYELAPYPGSLALFRPKLDERFPLGQGRIVSSEKEFVFHDNGWTPFVEEVVVYEVPGDHDSMVLEPNVRALAAKLAVCIQSAESGDGPENSNS